MALGIVFDGDDTLWSTEQLYDEARSQARQIISESGLDGDEWEELERAIDVENVTELGYSMERFPTSCVQAYEAISRTASRPVDNAVAASIRRTAESVFERDPPLISGAKETLEYLRARGARLALLTKGDIVLQNRRVEHSGLRELFDIIRIVPDKSSTAILDVVAALGVAVDSAWMVGNSMRSDVLPAIEAGLRAVWIPAHVWEYERSFDNARADGTITALSLEDVRAIVAM